MLKQFVQYVEQHNLFRKEDVLLVGISGGVDSVVLVHLLHAAGYSIALAHCNFKLRGEESDQDEAFVARLADRFNLIFHVARFDTKEYALDKKISVEMAARELRYEWFERLCTKHHYSGVAVAHHRDDQIETFFLNLSRGAGISGLTGMSPKNGRVVRPLLFASRADILSYSRDNWLAYREDSTNAQLDFQRNRIRHQILPAFESIYPSFRDSVIRSMDYLSDYSELVHTSIDFAWERVAIRKGSSFHLSLAELRLLNPLRTYLFEFLRPYGFNSAVVEDVLLSLNGTSGKQFYSATHRLVLDREVLVLSPLKNSSLQDCFYLEREITEVITPIKMRVTILKNDLSFKLSRSKRTACIDLDKLSFPLQFRKWRQGDYFIPLGMKGMKKISDFFIDEKLDLIEKEQTWLMMNEGQIVWVVGRRLDERFKVTNSTKQVLRIDLL